jgi:hypothetical protein
MSLPDKSSCMKKQWEKPLLVNLGVESTEFGGGGALNDISNTASATRTS